MKDTLESFLEEGAASLVEGKLYEKLDILRPEIEESVRSQQIGISEILDQVVGAEPRDVQKRA